MIGPLKRILSGPMSSPCCYELAIGSSMTILLTVIAGRFDGTKHDREYQEDLALDILEE